MEKYLFGGIIAFIIVGALLNAVVNVLAEIDMFFVMLPVSICGGIALLWALAFLVRFSATSYASFRRQMLFVAPDKNGLLPVAERALLTMEGTMRVLDVHERKATAVPNSIHFAPKYNNTGADVPMIEQQQAAFQPETFWQLWQGRKLPDDKILMGYDIASCEMIFATWRQLYSALVGGTSGSGKSTAVRLMLAQSAMQGGQFVIVDPHYGSGEESLGASLMPLRFMMPFDVASEENQMVDALRWVTDVGKRRLSGVDTDRTPLVLVVDEVPGLLEGGYGDAVNKQLKDTLSTVVRETRKVNVYAFAIGQSFQAQIMPSKIRNSFASMVGCSLRKDEARYMSGNSRFASAVDSIVGYQAVWMNPQREIVTLAVPNCTEHDISLVASHLAPKTGAETPKMLLPPVTVSAKASAVSGAKASAPTSAGIDAKALRALEMTASGAKQVDIISEVWGVTGKGPAYKKASAEYRDIMKSAAQCMIGAN